MFRIWEALELPFILSDENLSCKKVFNLEKFQHRNLKDFLLKEIDPRCLLKHHINNKEE